MKILKVLEGIDLVLVNLEVSMGDKNRSAPVLCARMKDKIIPLNSAHDGRPIIMNEDNEIPFKSTVE